MLLLIALCLAGCYNHFGPAAHRGVNILKRIGGLLTTPESPLVWEITIVVIILLVATFFRTHLLEAAPPGLQHDEIFKANFALDILDGGWPVFFNPNGGEEALFPYLAAISMILFGHNFFALRLVSLVCGILSIVFSYCLIKELFGRRVGLLTAAGLAISFWHIFDSRVALRPITLLFMVVTSFYFFWLGLKRGKIIWFVLTGIFLGGTLYTYTSAVLIPVTIILFILLYQLPFQRDLLFKRWRGILLVFGIALIIFLPMGHHLYTYPAVSTARVGDLSDHINLFLAGHPGPLLKDVLNVAGMFGFRGDPEWRYNLAGKPVFDALTFLLFCGGLVICMVKIRRPEYAFLLLWLGINIIPSAITRNSPSTLRAIGSLTAIYTLPSLTIDLAWDWIARRFGSLGRRALLAAIILLLAFNAFSTYWDYFTVWAQNCEVRDIYRADLSAVARYLDEQEGDETVCLSASFAADLDQQVLSFMSHEPRFIKWFDGRQTLVFPEPSSSSEVLYIFPATCPLREELMARFLAHLPIAESVSDPYGEPTFVAYRLGTEELANLRTLQPRYPLSVNFEDRVELIGYELPEAVEAGSDLHLLLYWRVPQPIRPDLLYTFFAHMVDMRGFVWAQADTLGYPVSSWIQGDLVVQWFDLTIPPDAPPLEYEVKIGMYDLITGDRLVPMVEGVPLAEGVVTSERFFVTRAATPPRIEELNIPRLRQANFDQKLNLLGCDLEPLQVSSDDAIHVSLYWQALAGPESDCQISVFFMDDEGNVWGEFLRQPLDGDYPTTLWKEGEVVRDRFNLPLDPSAPTGRHRLWVRVYDPTTQTYLPVEGSDEEYVRVGRVRVVDDAE
jgi:4-amino-4-deoxy-L-arabinose transferase-like glycosyltransferase